MEDLKTVEDFVETSRDSLNYGYGSSDGYGSGYDRGYGRGSGSGYGYGNSRGNSYGNGCGDGSGSNSRGDGDGHGFGCGDGYGSGHGSLLNLATFCGHKVYPIDDTPTLIDSVRRHYAIGAILNDDLTLSPCIIAKGETSEGKTSEGKTLFAHGTDIHKAFNSLQEKLYKQCTAEERIVAFQQKHVLGVLYPNTDFFKWHHLLTGSCQMGRKVFVKNHGIDMNDSMTVEEFISLTENDFGQDVILKLKGAYVP